jgi:hypothetical protein
MYRTLGFGLTAIRTRGVTLIFNGLELSFRNNFHSVTDFHFVFEWYFNLLSMDNFGEISDSCLVSDFDWYFNSFSMNNFNLVADFHSASDWYFNMFSMNNFGDINDFCLVHGLDWNSDTFSVDN